LQTKIEELNLRGMKLLFVGDVVGKPGRAAVRELVPALRKKQALDFVVVNGENAAGGAGVTPDTVTELIQCEVDVITSGDHIWDKSEIMQVIDRQPVLLRPLNFPCGTPGQGVAIVKPRPDEESKQPRPPLAVVNLMGRVFMRAHVDCPFRAIEAELDRIRNITPLILVDMHAEATSEKCAMGRFLDGRVTAVVGTHTHVTTADEQILAGGTAYITDVGMCGPHDSVLGREVEPVIKRFMTQLPQKFAVATANVLLNGVVIEADGSTGKATKIERIRLGTRPPK
jgi:metallophosphoesterase (TIGR00282 family)